jgi:mitochondrial fission protein ELM1
MARIWALSIDGNLASLRQVTAFARALSAALGMAEADIRTVIPRLPPRAEKLPSNYFVTWTQVPTAEALAAVSCTEGALLPPWPDIVVGCRPEVAGLALGIRAASGGAARLVHIQSPNDPEGRYAFDTGAFDLLIRQPQESLSGLNVLASELALHGLTKEYLRSHQNLALKTEGNRLLGVLVGGTDEYAVIDAPLVAGFAADIASLCARESLEAQILTSRRTGADQTRILKDAARANPRLKTDAAPYTAVLATADAFVVTADSLSMVSEALATGKPCFIHDFGGALDRHPLRPVLRRLEAEGRIKAFPNGPLDFRLCAPTDELPALALQACKRLGLQTTGGADT